MVLDYEEFISIAVFDNEKSVWIYNDEMYEAYYKNDKVELVKIS